MERYFSPGRAARGDRAFTLIETMVALVVMLMSLLAMLAVVPFAFTNVETNSLEVQAVAVGQQFLEDERNAKLHSIPAPSATNVPIDAGRLRRRRAASISIARRRGQLPMFRQRVMGPKQCHENRHGAKSCHAIARNAAPPSPSCSRSSPFLD